MPYRQSHEFQTAPLPRRLDLAVAPEGRAAVEYQALYQLWAVLGARLRQGGMARDEFREWERTVASKLWPQEIDIFMRPSDDDALMAREHEQSQRHVNLRRILRVRKGLDVAF